MRTAFYLCTILLASYGYSQHNNELYNDGSLIHIEAGADVHVWGDVHMVGATSTLDNNGFLKIQGHTYGDGLFQQRGTGTARIENSDVNIGERQFIQGSYGVRSNGTGSLGIDDGSFYDLELGNDQGIVYLINDGSSAFPIYVADVRNTVDYWVGGTYNRIITEDIGVVGPMVPPANGSGYTAVFGIMNTSTGLANQPNNTVSLNGNMSGVDWGYVQGKLRRALNPAGGSYGYVLGLEPAGAGMQRGMQYTRIDFAANTYDVITGYFETASPNAFAVQLECTGETMDYFGGVDHGEWNFLNIAGGAGTYTMNVWPQDDNFIVAPIWGITKDDSWQGTINDCGPSPVGLSRSGLNGFSEFSVAAPVSALPIELLDISAVGIVDHIDVAWNVSSEVNLSHYELERSEDGVSFGYLSSITPTGGQNTFTSYLYNDYHVQYSQNYYYRVKSVDFNGSFEYSPIVVANISKQGSGFDENSIILQPNPSFDNFAISIYSDEKRDLTIEIFNSLGQVIERHQTVAQNGNTVVQIGSNEWAYGVYYVELQDIETGETITKRFIKH